MSPSPINTPPTGKLNIGFSYAMKAMRKAITMGRGCGKSGIRDKLKIMLARVVANVRTLSIVDTLARSEARLFFCFSYHSLNPDDGFSLGLLRLGSFNWGSFNFTMLT